MIWLKFAGPSRPDERRRVPASITFVSVEKETSARGRLVGSARAVHSRSRLRVLVYLCGVFLLVVVLWCVGNPDLWDRGLVCFWGTFLLWLVYPNLPIAWAQDRARITIYTYIYMFVDSLSRDCIENRILSFNFANRAIRHPYTRRDVLNGCDTSQSAVLPWWLWPCTYHAASAKFAVLVPL